MDIEIGPNLRLICDVIARQCPRQEMMLHRKELLQLCSTVNAIEKYFIAKHFCKQPWNIGSLSVLSVLHELRILSASEFVLSLQDSNELQLILNDFLEDEHHLLSSLFVASFYDSSNGIRISSLLEECLSGLFKDVLENPNLSDLKYLKAVKKLIPDELLPKVSEKHLSAILDLHTSNIRTAFRNFSTWINDGVDNIKFTKTLCETMICGNEQAALNYLFRISINESFKEWKFYLILLQTIASQSSERTGPMIRKYLETRLRYVATQSAKNAILHLLLTARATTATTMDIKKNLDAYAHWYKQNIGEMKIIFKGEEFKNVIKVLEESLEYEQELDYIEIHSLISISPPILCGKIVQAYKSKCKQRLSQIKRAARLSNDINETIVIDDSD